MGFIFPVKDRGALTSAALFGGAWLTPQILSDEALQTFRRRSARSIQTKAASVDVLLQNHMLMVPIQRSWMSWRRKAGDPIRSLSGRVSEVSGRDGGCTRVNLARRKL